MQGETVGFVLGPRFRLRAAWHVADLLRAPSPPTCLGVVTEEPRPVPTAWLSGLMPKPRWGRLRGAPWRRRAPDSPAQGLKAPGCLPGNLFYVPKEQG